MQYKLNTDGRRAVVRIACAKSTTGTANGQHRISRVLANTQPCIFVHVRAYSV